MNSLFYMLPIFAACLVEAVEAFTIVLAAGTRSWRASMAGTAVALAVLGVGIAVLGRGLVILRIPGLQLALGVVLLIYGGKWLKKGVLRATGRKALHDEALAYRQALRDMRSSFGLAFQGVFTEGLEVVVIVLAMAGAHGNLTLASVAALAAVVATACLGIVVRRPLERVPENTIKLGVGVMLAGLGLFYVGEGADVPWPAGNASLLVLYILIVLGVAGCVRVMQPE